jgi:hypothetical protein
MDVSTYGLWMLAGLVLVLMLACGCACFEGRRHFYHALPYAHKCIGLEPRAPAIYYYHSPDRACPHQHLDPTAGWYQRASCIDDGPV